MSAEQLEETGLAGPYQLADTSGLDQGARVAVELKALRRQLNRVGEVTGVPYDGPNPILDRHMDVPCIRNLYFDAKLQLVLHELFGDNLFVWRTNFFAKSEGTGQNKWHHDRHFENGNEPLRLYDTSNHFTILIALTDIGMDAGRVEYVTGSHKPIPGWDRDIPRHIQEVPEVISDRVTPLPMERGQFVVFHSSVLHRSLEFGQGEGRVSLAARVAKRGTQIPEYGAASPVGGAHAAAEPIVYYRDTAILPLN